MANAWLVHVKATMKKNPGLKFKEVLKKAKQTYKKSSSKSTTASKKTRKNKKGKKGKK